MKLGEFGKVSGLLCYSEHLLLTSVRSTELLLPITKFFNSFRYKYFEHLLNCFEHLLNCLKLLLNAVCITHVCLFIFRLFGNPVIVCLMHCLISCMKE